MKTLILSLFVLFLAINTSSAQLVPTNPPTNTDPCVGWTFDRGYDFGCHLRSTNNYFGFLWNYNYFMYERGCEEYAHGLQDGYGDGSCANGSPAGSDPVTECRRWDPALQLYVVIPCDDF